MAGSGLKKSTAATSLIAEALGYETETKVLSVPVTYTGLAEGDIDVFLGNWMPTMEADLAPYRDAGTVETVRTNLEGAKYTLATNEAGAALGIKDFKDIAAQKDALRYGTKGPLVYTNVVLRNWRAFHKLGVSNFYCPTMFHDTVALTEAASLGGVTHAQSPDEPIALHLTQFPAEPGLPRRDQHKIGRARLLRIWGGIMDMSMDGSPIIDRTDIDGLYFNGGWCYGGFKATPASGWCFAHTIANDAPHAFNAGFTMDRFAKGRYIDEAGYGPYNHLQ